MRSVAIALLSLVVLVSAAFAQQKAELANGVPSEEDLASLPNIAVDVTRVNVLFTVSDRRGRFVTNLKKEDFEIFENDRPQEINEFVALTDLPLRLAILIDTSNSIRDRFRFLQEAAIEFINSVVRRNIDKAVVMSFDSGVKLESELTGDQEKLAEAIRDLRPGGGTALYAAIHDACTDVLLQDEPRQNFRRAVIILSDGEDNFSPYSRDQALEAAHNADTVLYTISTNTTRNTTPGDKVLKYMADETGGLAFFPFKVEDLTQGFENIANELRNQYNITYRPQPLVADGKYHPIEIHVKGLRNVVVRARKGYYAPGL